MLIRNVSDITVTIPSLDLAADPGVVIEVPDEVGAELVDRPTWEPAPASSVPTVADVLADVGDDPAKAQAALDVERARGGKARSTLVDALVAIAETTDTDSPQE